MCIWNSEYLKQSVSVYLTQSLCIWHSQSMCIWHSLYLKQSICIWNSQSLCIWYSQYVFQIVSQYVLQTVSLYLRSQYYLKQSVCIWQSRYVFEIVSLYLTQSICIWNSQSVCILTQSTYLTSLSSLATTNNWHQTSSLFQETTKNLPVSVSTDQSTRNLDVPTSLCPLSLFPHDCLHSSSSVVATGTN